MTEFTGELLSATDNGAQVIIDVAQSAVEPTEVDPLKTYVAPQNVDVLLIGTDKGSEWPNRKKGTVKVHDANGFVHYVKKHGTDESEVWADRDRIALVGVLNSHGELAGWGDHRVTFDVRTTDAWKAWAENDGRLIPQGVLAELFEQRLIDFAEPTGAHMLEVVQSFQATIGVTFESAKRLDNGERQMIYKQDVAATAGRKGTFNIPAGFTLGLRPFEGADVYKVAARFRYRITDGTLFVGYVLDRPQDIVRSAFADVVEEVAENIDCDLFYGVPDAPQQPSTDL